MKREYVQLAHTFNRAKHGIGGYYWSEKLDGGRAIWDGGVTRGLPKASVPWANTAKDERYKVAPIATGLWSRYGNVIHAPDWWLDSLPNLPLDGELYFKGHRQELMSIIKDIVPGPGWHKVKYYVFDAVPIDTWLEPGIIDNPNCKIRILEHAKNFYNLYAQKVQHVPSSAGFEARLRYLEQQAKSEVWLLHKQTRLPMQTDAAEQMVESEGNRITSEGGEGLIVRAPHAFYECYRTHALLKVKKRDDAEGTVIGYITGRATDKGSKLLGMMGALILRLDNGKRMELSGFTDEERTLNNPTWAKEHPETECPSDVSALAFPRGTKVTFKYRGKTKDGIPQEAAYWRRRDE